jgi:hypothetical protein
MLPSRRGKHVMAKMKLSINNPNFANWIQLRYFNEIEIIKSNRERENPLPRNHFIFTLTSKLTPIVNFLL